MDLETVFAVLNSQLRREILTILTKEPMSVPQVMAELTAMNSKVNYRESVYRALEKLVDAGFVEKYYDRQKGITYRILLRKIQINLYDWTFTVE